MKKFLKRILCLGLAWLTLLPAGNVLAITRRDLEIYSQNNIFFYDPTGVCDNGVAGEANTVEVDPADVYISSNDNAGSLIGTLVNNGYSREAAAAIVGNLQAESSLNPRVLEGGRIVDDNFRAWDNGGKTFNGGFGIAQWTTASRVEKLQKYADSNGLKVTSLRAQVGYLVQELNAYGITPTRINSMSFEEATFHVLRNYEGPAAVVYDHSKGVNNDYAPKSLSEVSPTRTPAAYAELNKRHKYAQQFLGVTPTGLPESVFDEDTGSYVNCVPAYGDGSPVNMDDIISFLQCDPAWARLMFGPGGVNGSSGATICQAGCGPTSFASIAATLGLNINPVEAADAAGKAGMYVPGAGSSWSVTKTLADKFGLRYERLGSSDIGYITSVLRSGKAIHVAGKGSMPYTSGGHYIGIVGVTDSGDWIVVDSGHGAQSAVKAYNPRTVMAGMSLGSAGIVGR